MNPKIAVDITARDKTDAGIKSADRRFGGFARKAEGLSKEGGGLGKLGKQIEGLGKFRTLNFDTPGRSLSSIGALSGQVASGFGSMTSGVLSFGGTATGVLGTVAEVAGGAATAIAGTAAAVVGLGVATYMLGDKWAKTGAEIGRTARGLGVTSDFLQRARAENERFGVSADQTTASVDGLATTLYDAKSGANNLALGALNQLGVKLKTNKDGVVDLESAYYDLSDAIARQKDPNVQRKVAAVFGLSGALPAIREGSATLKPQGADFAASGAELNDADVAKSKDVLRSTVALRQHLSAIEKTAGVGAMDLTGAAAERGAEMTRDPSRALTVLKDAGAGLIRGGERAASALVHGADRAAATLDAAFDKFVARIEHQESGGHQFEFRKGRAQGTLTSDAGAMGAMQMLEPTAERAAKWAGIKWDAKRFRNDKPYNESLGRAELQRLVEKFDGNQVLAAAAYNAGEGRITGYRSGGKRRPGWLQTIGDPRKGEISNEEFAARIPFAETRKYVLSTASMQAGASPALATSGGGPNGALAAPTKAHVEIVLRNAPPGTVATVSGGGPDLDVNAQVVRSMDGP